MTAREGEQPAGQLGAARHRAGGTLDHGVQPRLLGIDAAFDEFQIAQNSGQQIVEIMRDAAGEPPDGLELLRLGQRCLGFLALRHLDLQAVVGLGQFTGAFRDAGFQQMRCLIAFRLALLQPGSHFVERTGQAAEFRLFLVRRGPRGKVTDPPASCRGNQPFGGAADEGFSGRQREDQGYDRGGTGH